MERLKFHDLPRSDQANRLREILDYFPETGIVIWKIAAGTNGKMKPGSIAGGNHLAGYRNIKIDGKRYLVHRVAYLYVTGSWPNNIIDHINGNRSDNRWCNLRNATGALNQANCKKRAKKPGQLKGTDFVEKLGKWRAQIRKFGKSTYIGLFETSEEAHQAYMCAAKKQFGEFACDGERS